MPPQPPPPPAFPTPEDLKDLQGDVVLGFPKHAEQFVFFNIQIVTEFKRALKKLQPLITSTAGVQVMHKKIDQYRKDKKDGLLKLMGVNIAFTAPGLKKLGVTDSLGDADFEDGQLSAAKTLGDTGKTDGSGKFDPDWLPQFKLGVDGVLLIAGESPATVSEERHAAEQALGKSINIALVIDGNVRPGEERGHEHFGYLDGISSPSIPALNGSSLPGQQEVKPGVLILGQAGDDEVKRPSWAKNGSFLVYRHLEQLVPEFNKFVEDNPIVRPGLSRAQGSELLGARLVGRWKSGAPIDLTPLADDPELGKDEKRNNHFNFSADPQDQSRCPYSAHIRKTNPRKDLPSVASNQIMRQGIPFGPEVSAGEQTSGKTATGVSRGLAFVCYQSTISKGFAFIQEKWANNKGFPQKPDPRNRQQNLVIGFDPIIGTNGGNAAGREAIGTNPSAQEAPLKLPAEWVVPKGGAYFFVPPISALVGKLSAA